MKHLRHWIIAAALLSATPTSGLAAELLEGGHAAITGIPVTPLSAQRFLASDQEDSGPAGPNMIPGKTAGTRPGWTDALLASHAVQPFQRMDIGWGLSADAIAMGWYGVYLKSLDRVAERHTIYGLLRELPQFGPNDRNAPSALCCQGRGMVSSLDRHEKAITRIGLSPTFFVFGLLRNKGYALKLADDWKLQVGVRHMQYGAMHQTRLAFFTVERRWTSFRTSYSYQLERGGGTLAPSHVLQVDYLYSPLNSIGVSVANGREFANFGWLGVLDTEVRNVTVRAQHWFKQDWAFTFQAGINDHGSLPAQKGVRIGIRHSF